jgi:hypothetical protein
VKSFVLLLIFALFLFGCPASTVIREEPSRNEPTKVQYSPPISLNPIPLEGQSVPLRRTVHTEKGKIAVELRMDRASFSDRRVYVLKLRVTNSALSILEVDTKKVFVRPLSNPSYFFERISGETVQQFYKDERTLHDSLGYPRDWETSMFFIFLNEKPTFRNILSSKQLPRLGSVEGDLLFVRRGGQVEPDNLIIQLYLGNEEFTFRFVEE